MRDNINFPKVLYRVEGPLLSRSLRRASVPDGGN